MNCRTRFIAAITVFWQWGFNWRERIQPFSPNNITFYDEFQLRNKFLNLSRNKKFKKKPSDTEDWLNKREEEEEEAWGSIRDQNHAIYQSINIDWRTQIYLVAICSKMKAEETGSLQKFVKKIKEQRIVNWTNQIYMATMTCAISWTLTACFATAMIDKLYQ